MSDAAELGAGRGKCGDGKDARAAGEVDGRACSSIPVRSNAAREATEAEVEWAEPAITKPAPKRAAPKPAPKRAVNGDGPVGRMQTALATAIEADNDWTEF